MRELLEAARMDERKRKTPRPNLNRCAYCRGKDPDLRRIEGVKGTFCQDCEKLLKLKLGRKTICLHLRPWGGCGKKECVIRHVMES